MYLNTLLLTYAYKAKAKVKEFFTDETGAVDIVAIVVLIGIAVLLALTFQEQIEKLLTSLFNTIIPNAENAVNGTTGAE